MSILGPLQRFGRVSQHTASESFDAAASVTAAFRVGDRAMVRLVFELGGPPVELDDLRDRALDLGVADERQLRQRLGALLEDRVGGAETLRGLRHTLKVLHESAAGARGWTQTEAGFVGLVVSVWVVLALTAAGPAIVGGTVPGLLAWAAVRPWFVANRDGDGARDDDPTRRIWFETEFPTLVGRLLDAAQVTVSLAKLQTQEGVEVILTPDREPRERVIARIRLLA